MHTALLASSEPDFTGVLILLALYFAPTSVAMMRRKANTAAIFVLNLLLGWTGIGWIVAVIWALTVDHHAAPPQVIVVAPERYQANTYPPEVTLPPAAPAPPQRLEPPSPETKEGVRYYWR